MKATLSMNLSPNTWKILEYCNLKWSICVRSKQKTLQITQFSTFSPIIFKWNWYFWIAHIIGVQKWYSNVTWHKKCRIYGQFSEPRQSIEFEILIKIPYFNWVSNHKNLCRIYNFCDRNHYCTFFESLITLLPKYFMKILNFGR